MEARKDPHAHDMASPAHDHPAGPAHPGVNVVAELPIARAAGQLGPAHAERGSGESQQDLVTSGQLGAQEPATLGGRVGAEGARRTTAAPRERGELPFSLEQLEDIMPFDRGASGKTMKLAVRNGGAAVVSPVQGRRRHFQWALPAALARAVQALR